MRILQVITGLKTGGAERLLTDSLIYYQDEGMNIDILSLDNSQTFFREKLESITQRKIIGLTTKSVYNPLLILKIIPLLGQYDIVHIHLFPALYWVVLASFFSFSKTKLVYTEHSTSNRRRGSSFWRIVDRIIYRRVDKIISISESVQQNLKTHLGFSSSVFQVIYNGVNLEKIIDASSYDKNDFFSQRDIFLLQVAGFKDSKDQSTVIRCLCYLPYNVKLLLIGDGPTLNTNKELVKNLCLSDRVLFLGNRTDIAEFQKMCDISVVSSHWEGFGLAAVEGMAAHKPVIASDVDGLKQVIDNYGLLFEAGNEQELSKKIKLLIENEYLYTEYANRCFQRASDFDIKHMVKSYIGVYLSINKKTIRLRG